MTGLLLAVVLAGGKLCGSPTLINVNLSVLEQAQMFKEATLGCKKRYPQSPCVVRFERIGLNDYTVVCGRSANERP